MVANKVLVATSKTNWTWNYFLVALFARLFFFCTLNCFIDKKLDLI